VAVRKLMSVAHSEQLWLRKSASGGLDLTIKFSPTETVSSFNQSIASTHTFAKHHGKLSGT
jgi:hypothetical protein